MIRYALGGIKFGAGPTVVAPSQAPSADTGTVTPEESSLTPIAQIDGGVTVLRITDIQPYEKNPRRRGPQDGAGTGRRGGRRAGPELDSSQREPDHPSPPACPWLTGVLTDYLRKVSGPDELFFGGAPTLSAASPYVPT